MRTSTSRSAGLRKFIPQPDRYAARYGNFTLTARDMEILETVYRCRYLEARHIRALVSGSDPQITRRLQGLFHNKYLGRYARRERMRLELAPGAPLMAYGLELKGARVLEQSYSRFATAAPATQHRVVWRKDYTRRTDWFLEHNLMISNFRCVLELAIRQTGDLELTCWQQGDEVRKSVTVQGDSCRIVRIAPDAYFRLREGSHTSHFFLEVDRSTEEHRRLVEKFVSYWWYLQSSPMPGTSRTNCRVIVLFVTTGKERLANMVRTLQEMPKPNRAATHGGRGLFWFSLDTDCQLADPARVLESIWSNHKNNPRSILRTVM